MQHWAWGVRIQRCSPTHSGSGQSCGVLTLVSVGWEAPMLTCLLVELDGLWLWLHIAAFSLYCLPSHLVSDSCNVIFGVSLKIFKPFVMKAIPQQLLFLLGMGGGGQISAPFGPALHHGMQSWPGASAGKERSWWPALMWAVQLSSVKPCFTDNSLCLRVMVALSQIKLRGRGYSVLPCLRSSDVSSPALCLSIINYCS